MILWYRRNDVFDENIGAIPEGALFRMIMRNVSKPAALVEMLSNGRVLMVMRAGFFCLPSFVMQAYFSNKIGYLQKI